MLREETDIIQKGGKCNTGKLLPSLYYLCVSIPSLFLVLFQQYTVFQSCVIYKTEEFMEPLCHEASSFIDNLRLQV